MFPEMRHQALLLTLVVRAAMYRQVDGSLHGGYGSRVSNHCEQGKQIAKLIIISLQYCLLLFVHVYLLLAHTTWTRRTHVSPFTLMDTIGKTFRPHTLNFLAHTSYLGNLYSRVNFFWRHN